MASIAPISTLPLSSSWPVSGISAPVLFRYSARGYTTAANDATLPNVHFSPRASNPLQIDRSLPLEPGGNSRVQLQMGTTSLINSDGALDSYLRDYPLDGRPIEIKVGQPGGAYASFDTLFKGTMLGRKDGDRQQINFDLRDASWELDVPVQKVFYQGTGGVEGGADVAGKPKPLCYGYCQNVSAPLINATLLLFQVHDGPIAGIPTVYDQGAILTYGGDVADITTAPAPAAGTFITQLSGGYFRLGANPAGTVTADVAGDASFGLFVSKTTEIAYRLISTRGGFSDSRIDQLSFAAMNGLQTAPVGIFQGTDPRSLLDLLEQLFAGISGWWGANRLGIVECGRLDVPAAVPVAYLTAKELIGEMQFIQLPGLADPPSWRFGVGYEPNWTIQDSDLAGIVNADRKLFLSNGYRYIPWADANNRIAHPRAQDQTVDALFASPTDAYAEATRLGVLYGTPRSLLRFPTKLHGFVRKLGETINVNLPVGPLQGGKNVVIVGQSIDASSNSCTLDLFW